MNDSENKKNINANVENNIEKIIGEIRAEEQAQNTPNSFNNEKKPELKNKKLKLHKLYLGKFTASQLRRKILKRIFIPSDRDFVKDFFIEHKENSASKVKIFYSIRDENISREDVQKLNRIAKDIKKQKGRINLLPIFAAVLAVVLILVFAYFFRNIISRKIVVSASEEVFAAKCDIGFIDFDLFDTHFQIRDYAVANKNAPMKNLFEIKKIDLYFDLLELSRGKFVCNNISVDGISWNTDRKFSGALPKKSISKKKDSILNNNPISKMVDEELTRIKNEVSISAGLEAIREQTDPKLILQRELNAFQSPKIRDEILDFAPRFIETWKLEVDTVYSDVQTVIKRGEDFATINFQEIDSVEKIYDAISKLSVLIKASNENIQNVKSLAKKIESDANEVETLGKNAEQYIRSDFEHIKTTASNIKEISTRGASGIVSDLFRIFYLKTLGKYYPRLMYLIASFNDMQRTPKKENAPSLADKSRSLARLEGRNFLFSDHSSPSLLFKNIQLSSISPDKTFSIAGNVQNITNDADRLNKAITMQVSSTQKQFSENFSGIVDLRKASPRLFNVKGDFAGLDLDLDANITGLPKLEGAFTTDAEVEISKNNDVRIVTRGAVNNAVLSIQAFEPEFLNRIYAEILSRINTVDITTSLYKAVDKFPELKVSTSVDEQILASVKKQLQIELARIREQVIAEGKKILDKIQAEYLSQITYSKEIIDLVKLAFTDSKAFEKMLQKKLNEAEDRLKVLSKKATQKVKDEAIKKVDETKKQVEDELKKQIDDAKNEIKNQLKDAFQNPFNW